MDADPDHSPERKSPTHRRRLARLTAMVTIGQQPNTSPDEATSHFKVASQ